MTDGRISVLRKLLAAGGRVTSLKGLDNRDTIRLRACERQGLAMYTAEWRAWSITSKGRALLEQAAAA